MRARIEKHEQRLRQEQEQEKQQEAQQNGPSQQEAQPEAQPAQVGVRLVAIGCKSAGDCFM